jgi:hypothetical protein
MVKMAGKLKKIAAARKREVGPEQPELHAGLVTSLHYRFFAALFYSSRSARIGSTSVARRAGT